MCCRFLTLYWAQGSDARPLLAMIDERGPEVGMDQILSGIETFPSSEERESEYLARVSVHATSDWPVGDGDGIFERDDLILNWNPRLEYVGLLARLHPVNGIFDNGGKTMDRYRISLAEGGGFFASEDVSPRGVFIFDDSAFGASPARDETEIGWSELPWPVRRRLLPERIIP